MKTGVLHNVQGSAYIERDGCKVLSWVIGPREIPKKSGFSLRGVLVCNFKYAPMAFEKYPSSPTEKEEAEFSVIITEALDAAVCLVGSSFTVEEIDNFLIQDRLPKSQVDVCVLVLENSPAALATALTSASMALVDANIPMYDIIVGSSLEKANGFSADEKGAGQENAITKSTLGYMPSLEQVCSFLHEGLKTEEALPAVVNELVRQSTSLYSTVKQHLISDVLHTNN